jgi:hypothetical protein
MPEKMTANIFMNRHHLHERSFATVLRFNGLLELLG